MQEAKVRWCELLKKVWLLVLARKYCENPRSQYPPGGIIRLVAKRGKCVIYPKLDAKGSFSE